MYTTKPLHNRGLFNNWRRGREGLRFTLRVRFVLLIRSLLLTGTRPCASHSSSNSSPRVRIRIQQNPCITGACSTIGGEAEIRTLGGVAPSTVFKTAALNHSATSPYFFKRQGFAENRYKTSFYSTVRGSTRKFFRIFSLAYLRLRFDSKTALIKPLCHLSIYSFPNRCEALFYGQL